MFKELLSVRASLKSGKADQALAELEAVLGPMALADIDKRRSLQEMSAYGHGRAGSGCEIKPGHVILGADQRVVGFVGGGGGAGFAGASAGSGMPEAERTPYQKMLDKIANAPKAVKGVPVMVNMKLARVKLKQFAELNNCSTLEQAVQMMGFKSWISSPFINTLSMNYVATPYGEHLSTFLGEEIITNKITGQQARS